MRKFSWRALALAVVGTMLAGSAVVISPEPAQAADGCEGVNGLMTMDVMNAQNMFTQVMQTGEYPSHKEHPELSQSYAPCQFYQDKYDDLQQDIITSWTYVDASFAAVRASNNKIVRDHYMFQAQKETANTLESALREWAVNTEPSAPAEIMKAFWAHEFSYRYALQVYWQVVWHLTYMGEKEGQVERIYDGLDIIANLGTPRGKVKSYLEAYEEGYEAFTTYKMKQIAAGAGYAVPGPMAWIDSYMSILSESKNIVMPVYNKTNRTILQASWMSLVGLV